MDQPEASSFFERYGQFIRSVATAAGPGSDLSNLPRLRHRHAALIASNRNLLQGARVLDLMSSMGFWSLAALDAGAAHVVGLENRPKVVESAIAAFAACHIPPESYQFINSDPFAGLRSLTPGSFDLVLCHGFLERSDPRFFFQQISRLQVKHVILDTRLIRGKGPIIRLVQRAGDAGRRKAESRYNSMLSVPNHELVTFFCDYFKFHCREIDWKTMGITDWQGMADYQSDRRRVYVLEASQPPAPLGAGKAAASRKSA